jgi:hypothetical protein
MSGRKYGASATEEPAPNWRFWPELWGILVQENRPRVQSAPYSKQLPAWDEAKSLSLTHVQ